MSSLKPIKVWGKAGPNPPKPYMILAELDIPYEIVDTELSQVKEPEYLAINPNGRLPAIHDPNTNITLWESGAILEYLIETYDKDHKLSFPRGTPESFQTKQWLFFQTTGQGPYYGQAIWFDRFHPEKVPSAYERYVKEIHRVTGVLETYLSKKKAESSGDGPWLVGDKVSYADLAFVPWQVAIGKALQEGSFDPAKYPTVAEWMDRMLSRPSVRSALELTGLSKI